jgi:L-threonylcarbamoyladenylate synthase
MSEQFLPLDETVLFDPAAPGAIEMAAELIASGGVVAIPTDTVYGIAASLSHADALRRVFEIKNRDRSKPLPILVSSSDSRARVVPRIDEDVMLLLDEYWPGPLTIVLPAPPGLPAEVLAQDGTCGVRLPNHRLAIELIERAGGIVACTSANASGQIPAATAAEVLDAFSGALDAVVKGGVATGGVPSTVIRIDAGEVHSIRDGAIPIEHIRSTWDRLQRGRTCAIV